MRRVDQFCVVGRDELLEHLGRDHGGRRRSAAQLVQIVARAFQRLDVDFLAPLQNPQQFVHPFGIVIRGIDQLFELHNTGRVLKGARLPKHVETADMAADQPAISKCIRRPVDRFHVALRRGHDTRPADQYRACF